MSSPDELPEARQETSAARSNRLGRLFGPFWAGGDSSTSATRSTGSTSGIARLREMLKSDGDVPLKVPRIISLSLTIIFGIISWGIGINALVKARQQQAAIRVELPFNASSSIDVNIDDVFQTGVIITILSVLIAILSILFKLVLIFPNFNWPEYQKPFTLSPRSLTLQWTILSFLSLWLFTVLVPYTQFVRTNSAQIRFMINANPLLVDAALRTLQIRRVNFQYSSKSFLRLLSILPWFALLFTIASAVLIFLAYKRTRQFYPTEKVYEEQRRV